MPETDFDALAKAICGSHKLSFGSSLGSGSFKRVFRVDDSDGRELALKILRDPSPSERVNREADALRRCDHPNIAQIHQLSTFKDGESEYTFILEEYLAGGSLASRAAETGVLDRGSIFAVGSRLNGALEHLATKNLVHRDIKPDNIMFRDAGLDPVLVDFGLVRDLAAASLTQSWAARGPGTPYFSAPEQLNNRKRLIDWRTDQFSLAVSLAFCRYGWHPYQNEGELAYASGTVERVAMHGPRRSGFAAQATADGLPCLIQMTEPWSVSRFRRPATLVGSWLAQGD